MNERIDAEVYLSLFISSDNIAFTTRVFTREGGQEKSREDLL
jgi:hypothetical protein